MKLIGITGGIGSGKSTVCKVLQVLGFPVFYSDLIAKDLMHNDSALKSKIIQLFGEEAYIDGLINRDFIASLIFSNPEYKNKLNQLVHPAVYNAFEKFVTDYKESSLLFNESALLIETGSYKRFYKNILVIADEEVRIKRVIHRDKTHEDQVRSRIQNQLSDEEKIKCVDFVIENNNDSKVLDQVLTILEKLMI